MKCAYCSTEIKKGTGMMYVYRIGDTAFYCSNSCFKNHVQMGRKINKKIVQENLKGTHMERPRKGPTPQPGEKQKAGAKPHRDHSAD